MCSTLARDAEHGAVKCVILVMQFHAGADLPPAIQATETPPDIVDELLCQNQLCFILKYACRAPEFSCDGQDLAFANVGHAGSLDRFEALLADSSLGTYCPATAACYSKS